MSIAKLIRKLLDSVFDVRDSHVASFVDHLANCRCSFLHNDLIDINENVLCFISVYHGYSDKYARMAVVETIPIKIVSFTKNTRSWITLTMKSLT